MLRLTLDLGDREVTIIDESINTESTWMDIEVLFRNALRGLGYVLNYDRDDALIDCCAPINSYDPTLVEPICYDPFDEIDPDNMDWEDPEDETN